MEPTRPQIRIKRPNIHIAVLYAGADGHYWQELERHINLLVKMHSNVRIWTMNEVQYGQNINAVLKEELKKADITLLLLSADFATEKIFDQETRILLDSYARQKGSKRYIIPVIVRDFIWRDHYDRHYDIEKLTFFDKILHDPDSRERVYKEITELLSKYIQELNAQSINMVIPTWVGYLGGIMYNKGFVKNRNTRLYQRFTRTLQFELNDEVEQVCDAWLAGEANLIWSTIDRLPYLLHRLRDFEPKVIFQASWSNGADAIIARNGIHSIEALRGKKVIYPYQTPAHTFLRYILEEAGLDPFDIVHQPQKLTNLDLITKTFIQDDSIDALALWSPYIEACLNEVPGATILAHTGNHPNLIADVFVASKDYVELNREELAEFFSGWLKEISQFSLDEQYREEALRILIDAIIRPLPGIIPSDIRESLVQSLLHYFKSSLDKVHLCNYPDNLRFFGIPEAQIVPGEQLYNRFLKLQYAEYTDLPHMQWDRFVDTSILERIQW